MTDHHTDHHTGFPPPMHTEAPTSEPTDAPAATPIRSVPTRLPHPVAMFAVAFGVGTLAALVSGFGVGAIAFSMSSTNCSPSDGWCDLGAALVALFFGVIVGTIAYIVAGVTTIFQHRPAGLRGGHVIAHLVFPPAAFVLLSLLGTLFG